MCVLGMYAPSIASEVMRQNKRHPSTPVHLKGIAIGNGWYAHTCDTGRRRKQTPKFTIHRVSSHNIESKRHSSRHSLSLAQAIVARCQGKTKRVDTCLCPHSLTHFLSCPLIMVLPH
jgi:carboxypeptidase C (cathepsin A)